MMGEGGKVELLAGLSLFAALILITSCINFANLSLSQVLQRSKEIGVRKTLGANRSQIIIQFIFESLVLTFLAMLVATPLIYLATPIYTNLTNTGFTFASIFQTDLVIMLTLFAVLVGFVSGLFPALALSRFQAANIIKGVSFNGILNRFIRPSATVLQFALSTAFIIFAIAINLQISHLNTTDNGFNKDNLLILDSTFTPQTEGDFDYTAMVNELEQYPGIISVAKSFVRPPQIGSVNAWILPGFAPGEFVTARRYFVDQNFVDTMQFELLAGRTFSEEFPADFMSLNDPFNGSFDEEPEAPSNASPGIVLTRFGAREFGFASPEDALGKIVMEPRSAEPDDFIQNRVIGVIEDFQFIGGLESPMDSVRVLSATQDPLRILLIRIDPAQMTNTLEYIDEVWSRHRPDVPVNRTFYDQVFGEIVAEQTNGISKASVFASIITVLISAFGLYALAFYASEKRTKEIGIRKVLGATSNSIINLLTWDFLKPVLISCVVAWGVGFYAILRYFQQFSSQAEISIFLYAVVTVGTILIAGITVAFQCYKAAISDPVQSLRYE
jgi:putative ABC transport system permease protein